VLEGEAKSLMAPAMKKLKIWKDLHEVGSLQISPFDILAPDDLYGARQRAQDHVDWLKESFIMTDKINRRGIHVFIKSAVLWEEWSATGPDARKDLLVVTSVFYLALMACEKRAPKGDHSCEALRQLGVQFPQDPKFRGFPKGIKVYLGALDRDDIDNLQYMGNIDNYIGKVQRPQKFDEQIWQLHTQYVAELMLRDEQAKRLAVGGRIKPADKRLLAAEKTERSKDYVLQRSIAWKVPETTIRIFQSYAVMTGEHWIAFFRIITGDYPKAPRDSNKRPIALKTQAPFISMMGMEPDDRLRLMNRVVNGDLEIGKFLKECKVVNAYDRIRREIVQIIDTVGARDNMPIGGPRCKDWADYSAQYPKATDEKKMKEWCMMFTALNKKAAPPPTFNKHIQEMIVLDDRKRQGGQLMLVHTHTASLSLSMSYK
jgi:hypothetical protein